eukprot:SAG25_NODE_102_length_15486_cov_22.883278_2_plen_63_part_00
MWGLKCKGQMEEYVLLIHRTPFCESRCTTFRRVVAMESSVKNMENWRALTLKKKSINSRHVV